MTINKFRVFTLGNIFRAKGRVMKNCEALIQEEKARPCPVCESANVKFTFEAQEFLYGVGEDEVELTADVHIGTCTECDFQFTGESAEIARHEAVCRHHKVMTPREIRTCRESYGLSRTAFAALTRLGSASLARWETGQLIQNAANDSLLFLMKFPENLERLKHRFSPDADKQMARAKEIQCANDPATPKFQTFKTVSSELAERAADFELNPPSVQ